MAAVVSLVVLLIGVLIYYYLYFPTPSLVREHLDDHYDYIIVGSGSAGAVLATRLSEDPNVRVLLLEAGDEETSHPDSHVPIMATALLGTQYDWGYETLPQRNSCLSMVGQKCSVYGGKILGGTSVLNVMVYNRGSRHDYDGWAALGNTGWSYEELLPYFKKSEHQLDPTLRENTEYHGSNGPLYIRNVERIPISSILEDAFKEQEFEITTDMNGKTDTGYWSGQFTINPDGLRCSTASCFLRPVMRRENLHVATNALVTKVVIDKDTKTATGVEYVRHGKLSSVRASREVIVSAGVIGSPKLLMLSGVGPKEHLNQYEIPVMADLSVGENLQDHVHLTTLFETTNSTGFHLEDLNSYSSQLQYKLFGSGIYSSIGAAGFGSMRHSHQGPDEPYPSLLFFTLPAILPRIYGNIKKKIYDKLFKPLEGSDKVLSIVPNLLHPKSRGRVRLQSGDPTVEPIIDPRHLTEQHDIDVLMEGVRIAKGMVDTRAFQEAGIRLSERLHPVCAKDGSLHSYSYWVCYIKHMTLAGTHSVGTCKMGPNSDTSAVVDNHLRVRGIKKLRVVDASIMPTITSGNTHAPTMAIAEKAADLIKSARTN